MNVSLFTIDNFLADFEVVRSFALTHDFTQAPEFHGYKYPGFCKPKDERFAGMLQTALSDAIGFEAKVKLCAFVAGTAEFSTQQWIHSDGPCANLAGVLYLFDKPGYGTAFWRHKETGTTGFRDYVAATTGTPEEKAARMRSEGTTEDAWTRTDYVDSVQNRLVVYPSDRFHSRWPEKAFGASAADGRLTLTCFFDIIT